MTEEKSDAKKDPIIKKFNPKINIGIDFGTDGTAIAYSFPGGKDVFIYGKWNVFGNNGSIKTNKTRTAILLDKNGNFQSFGVDAMKAYVIYIFLYT